MNIIVILMISILGLRYSIWSSFVYAEDMGRKDGVRIFAGGKGYGSLGDYRRDKIIGKIKRFVSEHNKLKFSALIRMLEEKMSSLDIEYLGGDDKFLLMVRDFYKRYHKDKTQHPSNKDKAFNEMKHMLDDYLKSHKAAAPVELDPDKIKTVIISPKKDNSDEDISK